MCTEQCRCKTAAGSVPMGPVVCEGVRDVFERRYKNLCDCIHVLENFILDKAGMCLKQSEGTADTHKALQPGASLLWSWEQC